MADVKWIKVTTDIFDDEKILLIESLPEADSIIVIWFKLLCLAGKQNNSGVFIMGNSIPYTDKMLSTIFRRKEATVQLALQTFQQFGMIEIIDDVITIPNWNKHQSLDAYEKKKERDRLYQAERRAAQKALVAKSSDTSFDASSDVVVSEEDKEEEKKEKKKKKEVKSREEDILMVASLLGKYDYSLFVNGTADLQNAILAFMEFRKGIKKPMTEHAIDLLIKKLNGMTTDLYEQVEIINQSIMNGWQGIFPLKKDAKNRKEVIPDWMKKQQENEKLEHMKKLHNHLMTKTAGNDPDVAARAAALKESLERT